MDCHIRIVKVLYKKKYMLAHGFANTTVEQGHLNKYGHELYSFSQWGWIIFIVYALVKIVCMIAQNGI